MINIFVQLIASEDKNFMMIIQFVMRGSVLRRFPVLVEYQLIRYLEPRPLILFRLGCLIEKGLGTPELWGCCRGPGVVPMPYKWCIPMLMSTSYSVQLLQEYGRYRGWFPGVLLHIGCC